MLTEKRGERERANESSVHVAQAVYISIHNLPNVSSVNCEKSECESCFCFSMSFESDTLKIPIKREKFCMR